VRRFFRGGSFRAGSDTSSHCWCDSAKLGLAVWGCGSLRVVLPNSEPFSAWMNPNVKKIVLSVVWDSVFCYTRLRIRSRN
jgi:hypothetical protein